MLRYVLVHQASLNTDWCSVMKEVAKSQYNLSQKSPPLLDQFLPTPNDIAEKGLGALLYSSSWKTLFLRMGLCNGDHFPRNQTLVFEYLDSTTENAHLAKKAGVTTAQSGIPHITGTDCTSNSKQTTVSPRSAASSQKSVNSVKTMKLRRTMALDEEESDGSFHGDAVNGVGKGKAKATSPTKMRWTQRIESSVERDDDVDVKGVDKGKAKATSPKKIRWTQRIESSVERDDNDASKEPQISANPKHMDLTIAPVAKELQVEISKGLNALQGHGDYSDGGGSGDNGDEDYANNDADDEEEEEKASAETGKKRKRSSKSSKKTKRQRTRKTKPKSASVVMDSDDAPPIATLQDENAINEEDKDHIGNMIQVYNMNQLYGLLMKASSGLRVVDFEPDEYGNWTSTLDPYEVPAIAGLIGRLIADPSIRKAAQDNTLPYFVTDGVRKYARSVLKEQTSKQTEEIARVYNSMWTELTHNQDHPTSSQSISESSKRLSDNWDAAMENEERRKIWSDPNTSSSLQQWLNVEGKVTVNASAEIDELMADVTSEDVSLNAGQAKTSMMAIYDDYDPDMETGSATDDGM